MRAPSGWATFYLCCAAFVGVVAVDVDVSLGRALLAAFVIHDVTAAWRAW